MRVFVTGATGFIGAPVVKELLLAGHEVLGLSRSDAGANALQAAGASVHRGSLEDLDSLRRGADAADAVIHLAFIHEFEKFRENCEVDKRAIEAMGAVLADTGRPLLVTTGLAGLVTQGDIANEDCPTPPEPLLPRVSEQTALALARKGVNAAVIRLPQVHNAIKQGLITPLIALSREKGVSAYVGGTSNCWSAVHVLDAARLYRLALEKHETGAIYHGVAEERIPSRDVAEAIGRGLKVPVVALSQEEAAAHFGWLSMFTSNDLSASGAKTRAKLGWAPSAPGLIADLEQMDYS